MWLSSSQPVDVTMTVPPMFTRWLPLQAFGSNANKHWSDPTSLEALGRAVDRIATLRAVLEARSEGAAEHAAAAVPLPASAVPASLHASLMARLVHFH